MKVLCFGEIMLRIAPESNLRLRQAMPGKVEVTFAGGEANVCASLAILGAETPLRSPPQCALLNLYSPKKSPEELCKAAGVLVAKVRQMRKDN